MESPQLDDLVDQVHYHAENENAADRLPTLFQHLVTFCRMGEETPEIGWLTLSRILQSSADREKEGHRGLQNDTKLHGTRNSVDNACPDICKKMIHSRFPFFQTRSPEPGPVAGCHGQRPSISTTSD